MVGGKSFGSAAITLAGIELAHEHGASLVALFGRSEMSEQRWEFIAAPGIGRPGTVVPEARLNGRSAPPRR